MRLIPTMRRLAPYLEHIHPAYDSPHLPRRAAQGRFDRAIDALNRLPRPAMALGVLALFVAAMVAPDWFAARMEALSKVPDPLWWLLGVIVSFYFGSRCQIKAQSFRRELAETAAQQHATSDVTPAPRNTPSRAA